MYTQYVGNDYREKKDLKKYKIWARPTITWSLECEETYPKTTTIDFMKSAIGTEGVDNKTM